MKITLDISAAVNGKAGLGRYATSLARALADLHPDSVSLFANRTKSGSLPPELEGIPTRTIRAEYKPWRMGVYVGQLARSGKSFNRLVGKTDLFHAAEHLLIPIKATPTVLTVHDLIYRIFPEHHKKLNYWYLNAAMPLFVRRANHIIAVSESTKRDLMKYYRTPEEKITVVYEAAAPRFVPQTEQQIAEVRARYGLPEQYILAVGTIEPRKNYARLVHALAALRAKHPDLKLVIAGSEGWLSESFYEAIRETGQSEQVIRPGWVTDDDLPALYAGATIFTQPSLYEGFGLPILEAMAVGVPAACSATSSVGEIAGDAALTFDPEDTQQITESLGRLLDDADLRRGLVGKGLARAAEFSWERAARETWAVYRQLIGDRTP